MYFAAGLENVAGSNRGLAVVKAQTSKMSLLQVICNDRIGRKIRVKCNPDDTIADLKKLIAAQCFGSATTEGIQRLVRICVACFQCFWWPKFELSVMAIGCHQFLLVARD